MELQVKVEVEVVLQLQELGFQWFIRDIMGILIFIRFKDNAGKIFEA